MAWPKGKPHPGTGRPKGSKNKNTDLLAICAEKGINVFAEMLTIAVTTVDPLVRFGMLKEIAPYLHAKKKEVLNLSDTPVEELLKAAEEQIVKDEPSAAS